MKLLEVLLLPGVLPVFGVHAGVAPADAREYGAPARFPGITPRRNFVQ